MNEKKEIDNNVLTSQKMSSKYFSPGTIALGKIFLKQLCITPNVLVLAIILFIVLVLIFIPVKQEGMCVLCPFMEGWLLLIPAYLISLFLVCMPFKKRFLAFIQNILFLLFIIVVFFIVKMFQ
jgi:hypothetical protein